MTTGLDGDHARPQGVRVQILLACCAVVSSLSLAVLAGCAAEYVLARRAARREQEQLLAIVTARRAARAPSRPVAAASPEPGRGSPYRLDPTPPA